MGNAQDFIRGRVSTEQITLLKGSVVYYLDLKDARRWLESAFTLRALYMHLMDERTHLLAYRNAFRDMPIHLEKLKYFKQQHPGLVYQLPQRFTATYLGMSREWLSKNL